MRTVLILIAMLASTAAFSDSPFAPGQPSSIVLFAAASPQPGAGEAHPGITLKDGTFCDLMSIICLGRAARDYGDGIYAARDKVIRGLIDQK